MVCDFGNSSNIVAILYYYYYYYSIDLYLLKGKNKVNSLNVVTW